MKFAWNTFRARQWYGFKPDQWATFLVVADHDAFTVYTAARSLITNRHVICLHTSAAAQAVLNKLAKKQVNTATAAQAV